MGKNEIQITIFERETDKVSDPILLPDQKFMTHKLNILH